MKNLSFLKHSVFIFFLFFSQNIFANSNIAYINLDLVMKESLAGKSILLNLDKKHKENLKKIESDQKILKDEENKLISQKNILSKKEYNDKLQKLKNKVQKHNENRSNLQNEFNILRSNFTKKLFEKLNPILLNYSKDKSLSLILPKKNIVIGKTELDITNEIIKILDNEIKEIKIK